MEKVRFCEAVELMYNPSLQQLTGRKDLDPAARFCKVFPSLKYNLDFLQSTIQRVHGHHFAGIPLINDPTLL
jgi:hypothetical protein